MDPDPSVPPNKKSPAITPDMFSHPGAQPDPSLFPPRWSPSQSSAFLFAQQQAQSAPADPPKFDYTSNKFRHIFSHDVQGDKPLQMIIVV